MVFHAYIKWANKEHLARYLITAPNADTVDEWWRAVSTPANKHLGYKRLAPDFYMYSKGYPFDTAPEFTGRLIFTLLNDRDGRVPTLIADQKRTDHRSGQSYYIRSKSNPRAHWWVSKNGGRIMSSITARTRFHFSINGKEDGTVMIGEDIVSIRTVKNSKHEVGIWYEQLHLGATTRNIHFGDLKNHFLGQETSETSEILKIEGAGEEWELVC